MNHFQRLKRTRNSGFTLVELMIGMVVLMIGVMATMAMQTSALAGYSATRDGTAAADLGRAIEQMVKTEAIGWNGPGFNFPAMSYNGFDTALVDADAVLGSNSVTRAVNEKSWEWHRLTKQPTDNNFSTRGPQRFCSYVNGGPRTPTTAIEDTTISMFIVQIAVVYPAARGTFKGNLCPEPAAIKLNSADTDELELSGLRGAFFATQVYPRGM